MANRFSELTGPGESTLARHRPRISHHNIDLVRPGLTFFEFTENDGPRAKLEQMVLVTASGCELLSQFPFEADLLSVDD